MVEVEGAMDIIMGIVGTVVQVDMDTGMVEMGIVDIVVKVNMGTETVDMVTLDLETMAMHMDMVVAVTLIIVKAMSNL